MILGALVIIIFLLVAAALVKKARARARIQEYEDDGYGCHELKEDEEDE